MIMWWRQEGAAANGHKRNRQGPGNMRLDKAENQTDVNSSKARQGERYEMGNRGFDTLGEQQDDRAEVAACIDIASNLQRTKERVAPRSNHHV